MAGMPKRREALEKLEAVGIDALCEEYAGESLSVRDLAARHDVSKSVLHRFLERPEHAEKWAAAQRERAAGYADECIEIADDSSADTYMDANGNVKIDREVVNRSKLRVETRKWIAGVLDPDRFGEKRNGVTVNIGSVHLDVLRALRAPVEGKVIEHKS